MATYGDLVTAALVELGVVAAGETPASVDATLGLATLNRLIDRWNSERLQLHTQTKTVWTIVSNDGEYTVGSGGNVNVARPIYIDHVNFQDTSTSPDTEYQLQPYTDDAWSRVVQKEITSPFPTAWYYNPTFPLGTLSLWPVPTSSTLQGVMYAWANLVSVAAADTVQLPPGYQDMIVTNLAVRLAPSYTRQPSQELVAMALESKADVKRSNKRLLDMSFEAGALVQEYGNAYMWNINTGP